MCCCTSELCPPRTLSVKSGLCSLSAQAWRDLLGDSGASIFLLLFFFGTHVQAGEPTPEIDDFLIQIRIAFECMNVQD